NRSTAHQRGRPATEEDAAHLRAIRTLQLGDGAQFTRDAARPAHFVVAVAHMRIEIAIGALLGAERPMHIDAERAHPSVPGAIAWATNFAKARARCDMACFSLGSISPKVKR